MKTFHFDTKKAHILRIRGENGVILQGEQVQRLTLTSCCCSEGGLSVGNVCSAQLRGVVTGAAELLDEVIWAECVFTENGVEKSVLLGCFRVTEWLRTEDTAELTAYDALYWGTGGGYLPDCGENPKVNEVLADLARQMGVDWEAQSGLGELIRVGGDLTGHSIREMLGRMAALAGGNAVLTREGRLKVVWFSEGAAFSQEEAYSGGLTTKGRLFLAGMQVSVPNEGDEEQTVLSVGAGSGFVMELENPCFNEAVLGQVWQELSTFNEEAASLTGVIGGMASLGSLSVLGGLETEVGDLVTMTGKNGEKTVLPAMSVVLELDGGSRCTVSAMGQGAAETGAVFQGMLGRSITRLQGDVAEFRRVAAEEAELLRAKITNLTVEDIKAGIIRSTNFRTVAAPVIYPSAGLFPHETLYPSNGEEIVEGYAIDFGAGVIYGAFTNDRIERRLEDIERRLELLSRVQSEQERAELTETVEQLEPLEKREELVERLPVLTEPEMQAMAEEEEEE